MKSIVYAFRNLDRMNVNQLVRERTLMPIKILQRRIEEVALDCQILRFPKWMNTDRVMVASDIKHAIKAGCFLAPDESRDPNSYMTAQDHAARVAWLIKFADLEKVTITIAKNKVVDGNHRLSACIYSKIKVINCVVISASSKVSVIAA
jgi:hypothetical protein